MISMVGIWKAQMKNGLWWQFTWKSTNMVQGGG